MVVHVFIGMSDYAVSGQGIRTDRRQNKVLTKCEFPANHLDCQDILLYNNLCN